MRRQYHPARLLLEENSTLPVKSDNKTSSLHNYGGSTNFDINMVMILAAFLFALVSALGVNSIVRCASRCSRRFAAETPDAAVARLASRGMKKEELRKIPEVVYKAGLNIAATDCAICLEEFTEGEIVLVLPRCNHGFHVKCVETWLLSHSSCPTCRQLLVENLSDNADLNAVEGTAHGIV